MNQPTKSYDHLHASSLRISKFHFLYALLFIVQTIIFHASKVITPELLLKRWFAAASLLIVTTGVWLFVRNKQNGPAMYRFLLGLLILADIAFAAFNVYTQRGYASKSVLLFLIPIIVASALLSRAALMATAIVAVAVYSTTAISYFVLNFNEGYMSELYAEVGFYSGIFLLTAGLLWSTVKKHR